MSEAMSSTSVQMLVEAERRYRQQHPRSEAAGKELIEVLPGGDTRTTTWYPPFPLVIERASGASMWDADGNEVLDFIGNYTSLIHGHVPSFVVDAITTELPSGFIFAAPMRAHGELAGALTNRMQAVELVRFTNSGTEANLLAGRLTRAATGRRTLAVAEHSYHGSWEDLDWRAAGITGTAVFPINDIPAATAALDAAGPIAGIFIEPVLGSGGVIPVAPEFLRFLDEYAEATGALLVFDEVMTFRLGYGGMQGRLGINPSLTSFGKLIGGGLPIGAVGGRRDIMEFSDPRREGSLAHGGTFNGHRLAMVGGVATLNALDGAEIDRINGLGETLAQGIRAIANRLGAPVSVTGYGSMLNLHAAPDVQTPAQAHAAAQSELARATHLEFINDGVFMAARGELCISTAMDDRTIQRALAGIEKVFMRLFR